MNEIKKELNEVFLPFKNKHVNEKCVVFGTGPSLKKYKNLNKDLIKIGCNEMVNYHEIMDYYFIGDVGNKKRGYTKEPEVYHNYKANVAKFIRHKSHVAQFLPKFPDNIPHATYYRTHHMAFKHPFVKKPPGPFGGDIVKCMADGGTIIFEALQFALYCGFSDIFIVGCDCNYTKGTFNSDRSKSCDHGYTALMMRGWRLFKRHTDKNYKNVNIKIVNPVSLKLWPGIKEEQI
jgi:hypothetical protein